MEEKERNLPENAAEFSDKTIQNNEHEEVTMDVKDMISSIVIALFGLYVLFSGIHMSITSQKMSNTAWYGTPGILPIVIGAVLFVLSVAMFISNYRKGARINHSLFQNVVTYLKSSAFIRIVVAIGLLAVYVFLLFPHLPFCIATVLYLIANMIFFREKNYPIWKIVLICVVFTVALYLFFSKVAGVPLR